ncbi:MAG: hypothetical protein KA180_07205 [Gemmatimonadales bacterium]|nr:hypothetical protein [Gemmatimonadales bacterium]MBP9200376.1 hypothetical protein [Gemmatimonadales bacterium]
MTRRSARPPLLLSLFLSALALAACGGGSDPVTPTVVCDGVAVTTLAVGAHAIVDPTASNGCLRLPAAGPAGAEYLVVAYSANGQETTNGVKGSFSLRGVTDDFAALRGTTEPSPRLAAFQPPAEPESFHQMLRARDRALSRSPAAQLGRYRAPRALVPPTVGSTRDFEVCKTTSCTSFVTVAATAQYVGSRVALYLDDSVPSGGLSGADITGFGDLFDQQLYGFDTTAFGRESDVDGNGIVAVLLTDQVNALSPNCETTGQIIVGYFFGLDLLPGQAHSNDGEVFYGLVPDPSKPICAAKARVLDLLPPTLIHEFQHMISFNRHVLLGGGAAEETWLNEGLSHYAEELGGRQANNASCTANNCLDQFAAGNLLNGYDYLTAPEVTYLVEPGTSGGTLRERGANWLFVRWLADQSPTDTLLGTDITRRLLGADQAGGLSVTGGAAVVAAAQLFQPGITFATLAGQFHLANGGEAVTGFTEPSGRLRFKSWNLAVAFDQVFPGPYPLFPDSTAGPGYAGAGTLRGGSGTYVRVVQPGDAAAVALSLSVENAGAVQPHYAVLRIR